MWVPKSEDTAACMCIKAGTMGSFHTEPLFLKIIFLQSDCDFLFRAFHYDQIKHRENVNFTYFISTIYSALCMNIPFFYIYIKGYKIRLSLCLNEFIGFCN